MHIAYAKIQETSLPVPNYGQFKKPFALSLILKVIVSETQKWLI